MTRLAIYKEYKFKRMGKVLSGVYYGTIKSDGTHNLLTEGHGMLWVHPRDVIKRVPEKILKN